MVWYHCLWGPKSEWLWAMLQFVAVAITIIFVIRQLYHQRVSNLLSILNNFNSRWNSDKMIQSRQHICKEYKSSHLEILAPEEDVLAFFEEMGLYLKKGVLDEESIWNMYSYLIVHYWAILIQKIKKMRADESDNTYFDKFEYLLNRMNRFTQRSNSPKITPTESDISKFIYGELLVEMRKKESTSKGILSCLIAFGEIICKWL
jgi:hypothetical protein